MVSLTVVRNTSLSFTTATKTEKKKRVMLQSTPLIKTQEKPQHQPFIYSTAQPQILPATPGHRFGGFCLFLWFFKKDASCFYLGHGQYRTARHQTVTSSEGTISYIYTSTTAISTLETMLRQRDNLNSPPLLPTGKSSSVYCKLLMTPKHPAG